jgi:hypothetical protein
MKVSALITTFLLIGSCAYAQVKSNMRLLDSRTMLIDHWVNKIDSDTSLKKVTLPDDFYPKDTVSIQEFPIYVSHDRPSTTYYLFPAAFHNKGRLMKLNYDGFVFHFWEGELIRTHKSCFQNAGWGLCNGFTSADFKWYWKEGQLHRLIDDQEHNSPCQCYTELLIDYEEAMAIKERVEEILNAD